MTNWCQPNGGQSLERRQISSDLVRKIKPYKTIFSEDVTILGALHRHRVIVVHWAFRACGRDWVDCIQVKNRVRRMKTVRPKIVRSSSTRSGKCSRRRCDPNNWMPLKTRKREWHVIYSPLSVEIELRTPWGQKTTGDDSLCSPERRTLARTEFLT